MENIEVTKKLKYILIQISKQMNEDGLIEVINHSEFIFENHWNHLQFPEAFNLELHITADIFTKYYNSIDSYAYLIKSRINDSSKLYIDKIKILPDYEKLELLNTEILPIITEWDEINQNQKLLIENLKKSADTLEFQNLGNTARNIINKIANEIFDPIKHKPKDSSKDVSSGRFKNQIHSYIDATLSGSSNSDLRRLARSAIDFVESSIDFMNATTHKKNADKHLAEVCVISTISAINIINVIRQIK